MRNLSFAQADAARLPFADGAFSLTFTSPPYTDARTYGIGAQRGCAAWVDWMLGVVTECCRVTNGLVIVNCAGVTRNWCYQPGPEGLLWEWWKRGGQCWRPLANGHPPKWAPGGEMSHRLRAGQRVNQWGPISKTGRGRRKDGSRQLGGSPSHREIIIAAGGSILKVNPNKREHSKRLANGEMEMQVYYPPSVANPGNLLRIIVGGGALGHPLSHENEAPFPEKLPEFFIKALVPVGGKVLDCFSGSGTTVAVAKQLGRIGIGCDLRMNQCLLGLKRYHTPYARKAKKIHSAKPDGDIATLFEKAVL